MGLSLASLKLAEFLQPPVCAEPVVKFRDLGILFCCVIQAVIHHSELHRVTHSRAVSHLPLYLLRPPNHTIKTPKRALTMFTQRCPEALAGRRRCNSKQSDNQAKNDERLADRSHNNDSSLRQTRRSPLQRVTTPEFLEMIKTEKPTIALVGVQDEEYLLSDGSLSSGDETSSEEDHSLSSDSQPETESKKNERKIVKFARKLHRVPELDVAKYMAKREMTSLQERMNAITVIPGFVYCFVFLLSGAWLNQALIDEARDKVITGVSVDILATNFFTDEHGCISSTSFPHLYALPPLPVIAAAFGIIVHAPFSFIYHWTYAHRLPPGLARTDHWSRRMDQAMIHVISASMSYATSGSVDFFLANLLFNVDCIYRQFKRKIRPRPNQIRIVISILAYTIPVLRRGDVFLFAELWAIFSLCGWLFMKYPIGGWSHSIFHMVVFLVPPLLLTAAIELPASQDQLHIAAQCAVLAKKLR
jgi:hypothetical protein